MVKRKVKKKKAEKKNEKKTDFEKGIDEMKKKGNLSFNYPESFVAHGVKYVREDKACEYANSVPEEMKEQFLMKRVKKVWWNPLSWFAKDEMFEPKGNLLFLMDNEGNLRVFDKVKSGYFMIDDNLDYLGNELPEGKEPKYLILKPNKLRSLIFENEKGKDVHWKCWVADINNVNALPENASYDCDDVADLVNKAVSGNKAFNKRDKSFSFGKWLPWIFGVGVVIYMGYIAITKNLMGLGEIVGYGEFAKKEVVNVVTQNISDVVPGGSLSG